MKVYVHLNCSSCKKALKWLKENAIEAEVINLLEQTPSPQEFQIMVDSYAGNLKKLFNTSGQVYRENGYKEKVATMTTEEIFATLEAEGMLIKRPFLITGQKGLVGFKEMEWEKLVG